MAEALRVLLSTDGQEAARTAQRLLSRIGDRERVEVTMLAVASFGIALDEGMRTEGRFSPEAGRRRVREVAATAAEELRADGFRAEDRTAADDPAGASSTSSRRSATRWSWSAPAGPGGCRCWAA